MHAVSFLLLIHGGAGWEKSTRRKLSQELATRRQIDTHHGAEVLDDGPEDHGDDVPGEVGCRGEDADVFETDDARDARTRNR